MNIDSSIVNQHLSSPLAVEQTKEKSSSNISEQYPKTEKSESAQHVKNGEKAQSLVRDAEELNKADVSKEQLEVLAEKLQDFVSSLNKGLQFSVHEESGRDVIKVIDRESDEVVRQYPSEEVLELVAKLSDAAGNFINSKA